MKYYFETLLAIIVISSIIGCKNDLSPKEYNHILDSLKSIHVPVLFDSVRFFTQRGTDLEIDSITPDGIIIYESRDPYRYFYRQTRHKDSAFWDVFEYDKEGRLKTYYKKYIYSGSDHTGYVVHYDNNGEVIDFSEGLTMIQKTGLKAEFSIYDVINKLKKNNIDLLKHEVYISYTNRSGKMNSKKLNDIYSWLVKIKYFDDYESEDKRLIYQKNLRICPDTGDILEEWIDK